MSHLLAILLALAGFALIALSVGRHQADLAGYRPGPAISRRARLGGYLLLAAVFVLDLVTFGATYGAIAWFGHLSIGAWGVVAWLCLRARRRAHSGSANV